MGRPWRSCSTGTAVSKRASDLAARFKAAAAGSGAQPPADPPAPAAPSARPRRQRATSTSSPAPAPEPRTRRQRQAPEPEPPPKPVHFTLDLARDQHRALRIAALDLGADAASIVRALLDEYEADSRLAQRVAARVRGMRDGSAR